MVDQWLRKKFNSIISSIAFYPALLAAGFLLLSYVMLEIDFSEFGKDLKTRFTFFRLRDAATARTITATIAGSVLSLTVFSFSMVMILLVQAATNLSNRMLDTMIGNRLQQVILGFYIGTIVYALFILSTIRDIQSGINIPAISIYILIFLTIIDIFLFIYFLHYITDSVKYQTVINRIHQKTMLSLRNEAEPEENLRFIRPPVDFQKNEIKVKAANYYQGFDHSKLLKHCHEQNYYIEIVEKLGKFLLKGEAIACLYSEKKLTMDEMNKVNSFFDFYHGQPINVNADYGFNQITEIAIKALSPGINDPGTAILSLEAIFDLLHFKLSHLEKNTSLDKENVVRILWHSKQFKELFRQSLIPIWEYGKNDYLVQHSISQLLLQLKSKSENHQETDLINQLYLITSKKVSNNILNN